MQRLLDFFQTDRESRTYPEPRRKRRELERKIIGLYDAIADLLPEPEPRYGPVLTYTEAMEYFMEQRPKGDPRVKKGALLRMPYRGGLQIAQLFLDDLGNPLYNRYGRLYGQHIIVDGVDAELERLFGRTNLIIIG